MSSIHGKSKYRHECCAELIQMSSQGKSLVQIAASFGVSVDTLQRWAKDIRYPDFAEAFQIGMTAHEAYWEEIGQKGTRGMLKGFNPASWAKLMSARHQDSWTDRTAQKIELKNEIAAMTNEEIDDALKALLAARELNKNKGPQQPPAQVA